MSDDVQLTRSQRSAAIDRAGENLALRSGAGCGKTFVLARRFTELLLREGAGDEAESPLSKFVALTFTEKAALEMSQRVRRLIAELAAGAHGDDRRKLLAWLEEIPEARISTIHSFCAAMLRAHAIEAGLDPNFAVCADELLTNSLRDESCDRAVLSAVENEDRSVADLLQSVAYNRLVGQVAQLVADRTGCILPEWTDTGRILRRWRQQLEKDRRDAWARLAGDADLRLELDEIAAIPCSDPNDRLDTYRREQIEALRAILDESAGPKLEDFQSLNAKPGNVGSKKSWGDGVPKEVRDRLKLLIGEVAAYAIHAEELGEPDRRAAGAIATLARLALDANDLYTAAKRRRGILDFTDLLYYSRQLLVTRPKVAAAIRSGISQLLIDECQDTDAFQVALLVKLIFGLDDPADISAEVAAREEGRVFLVGDAKQSIYRFRGAQVEVFEELCRRLGEGRQEDLDVSFRTHAAGAAFVNHLFAPLMGEAYTPIEAHRKDSPPQPSVEIVLAAAPEGAEMNAAESVSAQAGAVAQRIRELIDDGEKTVWDAERNRWRPARPGDIAVLFARMTPSLEYERQLALRNIPYYVVAGTGFFRQQEVYDVLNALRAIDNPLDNVAFFGVLRSGIFGLDDNALMHVAEALDPPYLPAMTRIAEEGECDDGDPEKSPRKAFRGLSEHQRETLGFAIELLDDLHRRKDTVGIDSLIARLLEETAYEATLGAQFHGLRMVGNVRRLTELARTASTDGLTLAEFVAQMDELSVEQSRFEQAAVAGEAQDVVRLMTIHKAKGLEFPVVFVPDLNAGRRGYDKPLLNRLDWGLTYNIKPADEDDDGSQAQPPLSYRLAKLREDDEQRREDIRKLYVAATRHKDHLVFVAGDWRTKDGAFMKADSHLAALDDVLDIRRALDEGRGTIRYADGGHELSVRRVTPAAPARGRRTESAGDAMLARAGAATQLAEAILCAGKTESAAAIPLLGALPASVGRAELAVTALSDFAQCPMLYRWRHELRAPAVRTPAGSDRTDKDDARAAGFESPGADAATMGTLYHRCMELLDFASPQPAGDLARRVVREMELEESINVDAMAEELEAMLAGFAGHELSGALRGAAKAYRELDFVMDAGPATLRGQIDLLWQDVAGDFHVVDYKSDRVAPCVLARHARGYELQVLLYAAAAERYFRTAPADATLYFLRPAETHVFPASDGAMRGALRRAEELAEELIRSRRSGLFRRNEGPACDSCPYRPICTDTVTSSA